MATFVMKEVGFGVFNFTKLKAKTLRAAKREATRISLRSDSTLYIFYDEYDPEGELPAITEKRNGKWHDKFDRLSYFETRRALIADGDYLYAEQFFPAQKT